VDAEELDRELALPGPQRLWHVGQAFREGYDLQRVFDLTKIDPWFLVQIEDIVKTEQWLAARNLPDLDAQAMRNLNRNQFSRPPHRRQAAGQRRGQRAGCAREAPGAGRAPGVQTRRYLRRRVRHLDRLHVLHV